ncbi:MAG: hypothetical protein QME49_04495, partial [bacterium]|nr:hypothetical protein [bacterium]
MKILSRVFIGMLLVLWANAAQAVITGTVTLPAGGEMWAGGSTHDIVWETAGGSSTHTAELWLSIDGGGTYPVFIGTCTHTAIGGTYTAWEVTATDTTMAVIKVMGTDSEGATFTAVSGIFMVDSTLPINPTACTAAVSATDTAQLIDGVWQNLSASPYFEWAGATDTMSGVAGYAVYWGTDTAGVPVATQTAAIYSAASPVPNGGIYYLRVRTKDNAGNWSSPIALFVCKYDVSAPPGPMELKADNEFDNSPWKDVGTFSISWQNPPDPSGIRGAWYKYDAIPSNNTDGTFTTEHPFIFATATAGSHPLYVWLEDNAGNKSRGNKSLVNLRCDFDGAPPAPATLIVDGKSINTGGVSEWKSTPDFSIDWIDPMDDSGIKGAWYLGGMGPVFAGTGTRPFTVTVTVQNNHQLWIWIEDNAGNTNKGNLGSAAAINLRWDSTPPTNPGTCSAWRESNKSVSIADNTWQNVENDPYFEWGTADDGLGSGVACYGVYWGTSSTGDSGIGSTQTATNTVVGSVSSDSIYYLRVKAKDNVGNWSLPTTLFTFKYESTSPTNPNTCIAWTDSNRTGSITNDTWQNVEKDPYFEWAGATDPSTTGTGSGVAGYTVYWGTSSSGDPGTGEIQTANTYAVGSVSSDSTYYLRVKTRDYAGNWSSAVTLFTFRYDSTNPTNPVTPCNAWTDNSRAVAIANNTWQKFNPLPYFEWSGAADIGSGIAGYSVYWGTSSTGEPGAGSLQANASYTVSSSVPSDSTYWLRVRTKDNAGNWSEPSTLFTFKYDNTSADNPTSCTAYLDNGTTTTISNNIWQNQDGMPYFEWSGASDAGSGIAGYAYYWGISSTGEPGTTVETTSPNYLPDMGVNPGYIGYLRVRTKDNADNWSNPITLFTVKYDATSPTNPTACTATISGTDSTVIANDTWQNTDATPYFEWSGATDTTTGTSSGVSEYRVYWGISSTGEPGTDSSQSNASYTTALSVPSDSIYYLRVRTKDSAGNWSSAVTLFTFRYDSASPSVPTAPCNAWADNSKQVTITTNTWQNLDASPYFEWSGASDSGSGLAGYSVYWGTSSTGEPGTGSLQTAASYIATSSVPSDSTCYLR